jgi:hypothetical protein
MDKNRKFDLVANQKLYVLTTSQVGYEIVRPFEVRIASAASIAAGDYGQLQSESSYVYNPLTGYLEFITAPSSEALTNGLEVDLVVAPLEDSPSMNFTFVSRWSRYIQAGALAYLQGQANKPWYDPRAAEVNDIEYWRGLSLCRRERYTNTTTLQSKARPASWL